MNAPYGAIVPVPSARALLITENVAVIRQLIAIKDLVDVPRADMRVEFVPLTSASASAVVDSINEMLAGKNPNPQDTSGLNLSLGGVTGVATDVQARNVRLLADAPNREDTIFRSKAVGEPPLMLAISVLHAIRDACASSESGTMPVLVAPATPESILRALASLAKAPAVPPVAAVAGAGA